MSVSGKYVGTFAEATHALPSGMHMDADYPFMLPKIISKDDKQVIIEGYGGKQKTSVIIRENDREYIVIEQSSSFEKIFRRPPQKFKCYPFKGSEL